MTLLLPYLFSFLIGYIILINFLDDKKISLSLYVTLAFALGLGVSSVITFFSFLVMNQYNHHCIIALNSIVLGVLTAANAKHIVTTLSTQSEYILKSPRLNVWTTSKLIFWLVMTYVIYIVAKDHPFGEWDAWALWNMKAKFLILNADSWRSIFSELHWHTQPDYPLLLPLLNVWGYAFSKASFQTVTMWTSILLTISCGLLLYAGLKQVINEKIALLASSLLIVNPFYLHLGTSQYADILLAFYLLASIIVFTLMLQKDNKKMTLLAGCFIGFLPFIKNEGIPMVAIFFFLFLVHRLKGKNYKSQLGVIMFFTLGLLITSCPTVILKYFLSPANRDILTDKPLFVYSFFNLKGLFLVKDYAFTEILAQRWQFIWIVIFFMGAGGIKKYFLKETRLLSLFLLLYIGVVILVYITTINFDLSWRLSRTLHRIFFYLLPSILFVSFYAHWRETKAR